MPNINITVPKARLAYWEATIESNGWRCTWALYVLVCSGSAYDGRSIVRLRAGRGRKPTDLTNALPLLVGQAHVRTPAGSHNGQNVLYQNTSNWYRKGGFSRLIW